MILNKNNQKGSTMMEALGVLTIYILLGAAGLGIVSNIWNLFKRNMAVNEARDIHKAISESYKTEGNYGKLFEGTSATAAENSAKNLCVEKIAPFQMCFGGSGGDYALRHRLGGSVQVVFADEDEGAENPKYNKYKLIFEGLSKKACMELAQINWFTQKGPNIYCMEFNDSKKACLSASSSCNTVSSPCSYSLYGFSTSNAAEVCSEDSNTISWTFF